MSRRIDWPQIALIAFLLLLLAFIVWAPLS